jgi:co-chaperonin GroES (HSP10)
MLKIKNIKPLFNKIVTTCDVYEKDEKKGGLIIKSAGSIKEYQKVISVGPMVTQFKVGDVVMINPTRYLVTKHQDKSLKNGVIGDNMTVNVDFPMVEFAGERHLLLYDSDVDYVIEGEEVDDEPSIVIPNKTLIV